VVHKAARDTSPLVPNLRSTFTHGASIAFGLIVASLDAPILVSPRNPGSARRDTGYTSEDNWPGLAGDVAFGASPSCSGTPGRRGRTVEVGSAIWYLLKEVERGEYPYYYAAHCMTNDRHRRIREAGTEEHPSTVSTMRGASGDLEEDAALLLNTSRRCMTGCYRVRSEPRIL
jgi:hypothetical protein